MSSEDSGKTYHTKATGLASVTVEAHSKPADIVLFGGCFCPFVQRAWVAFEYLGIEYQYYEVDPYKKPQDLLAVSPKGLVPGLRLNKYDPPRALNESTIIVEYLEELAASTTKRSLLPVDPYARALVRLQADHVSRSLVPAFYRFLQAQDADAQIKHGQEYHKSLDDLAELMERTERETAGDPSAERALGLWKDGGDLGWTDVMAGPWLFRSTLVLPHYRAFTPPSGPKFAAWLARILAHPAFARTCSDDKLYLDSYERYAFNRPNTSQVADAINAGRGLP